MLDPEYQHMVFAMRHCLRIEAIQAEYATDWAKSQFTEYKNTGTEPKIQFGMGLQGVDCGENERGE